MHDIDWSKIKTAHGYATLIPAALKELTSLDADERHSGYWGIDNYVILQGDLHEAAYYVIEPILEILENKNCIDYGTPLELLIQIAYGQALKVQLITIRENNTEETLPLVEACQRKFMQHEGRLRAIDLSHATERDREALQELLERIETFHTTSPFFTLEKLDELEEFVKELGEKGISPNPMYTDRWFEEMRARIKEFGPI